MRKTVVLASLMLLVGFVLLCSAIYYQQRVVANNEFLSKMAGKSIPGPAYNFIVSFNASMRMTIPLLATTGIILCIVGGFLLCLPKLLSLQRATVVLLLVSILFSNVPIAFGSVSETERWCAELTLQQPRNAVSIGGHVYVYDNHLSSTNPNAFVAFRIGLVRVDTIWGRLEWLEAGYFENQSGFWIYGASYIGYNYVENDVTQLSSNGANGEGYLSLTISQSESPNTFSAIMTDPGIGVWLLMEATFTIGGDNLYMAGSESNDQYNNLNGHYAGLWFSDGDDWYAWQNVESFADYPYYVHMGSSTNEFFTEGGWDFYTLTISASSGGTTKNPAPGTYTYNYGQSVAVTAIPYSGYYSYHFYYWILDGARKYANPITVTMDSDHTLKAYFYYSGGGGGCPILSVYDGSGYVEEGLLDIHNSDGIDVITSHVLIYTPEPVEHRYLLRLTEHEQTHSHIDQVQLYATLKDGTEIKLPLVSAVHSEDGDVLWELRLSDDFRTDTLGADHNNGTSEWIDLEFVAPEGLEIETFTFIIEGHNRIIKFP